MAKKSQAKRPSTKAVVEPIVKEEGRPHAWESRFDGGDMPTLKSVGYAQDARTGRYIAYVITTKGESVLKIEASEPDFKQVAEETAKTNFVELFMGEQT